MSKFIYSTLANDNRYTGWKTGGADLPSVEVEVIVKGGANVMDPRRDETRGGQVTEISDEEFDAIKDSEVFQRHVKNGFVIVSDTKGDPDKVSTDMTGRDNSAPVEEGDFPSVDEINDKGIVAVKPKNRK